MPLVSARCTACGDVVQIDKDKDAAICPSCGAAFIVEKAINNYGLMIQGQNVNILGDGISRDDLLRSALEHLRRNERKEAIENIDDAMKRGSLGKMFDGLRLILGVIQNQVGYSELLRIVETYKKVFPVWKNKADDSVSVEAANTIFAFIGVYVKEAWLAYRNSLPELMKNKTQHDSARANCQKMANLVKGMLSWGDANEAFVTPEDKNLPCMCRSFWAFEGIMCLSYLATCFQEGTVLSAEQVQQIYDDAAVYHGIVGAFHSQNDLVARIIPIHKGGEGVHLHRLVIKEEGSALNKTLVKTTGSVCSQKYFKSKLDESDPFTCFGRGCVMSNFVLFAGIALLCGAMAPIVVPLAILVLILFTTLDFNSDKKIELLKQWKASPVHGTQYKPNIKSKDFEEWLQGKAYQELIKIE